MKKNLNLHYVLAPLMLFPMLVLLDCMDTSDRDRQSKITGAYLLSCIDRCPEPGPTPPSQPLAGPGGSQTLYSEAEVICSDGCNYHARRTGEYILYRPIRNTDEPLPVIFYLNGYEFFDWDRRPPVKYTDMARHFALQGYTVICPVYGEALYPDRWVGNVIETIVRTLGSNGSPGEISWDGSYGIVGASIGATVAIKVAEHAGTGAGPDIPEPRIIVTHDAAGMNSPAYPFMPLDAMALPSDMSLYIIMAEESYRTGLQDESCFSPELSAACADFNSSTNCPESCGALGIVSRMWEGSAYMSGMRQAVVIPSDGFCPGLYSGHFGSLTGPPTVDHSYTLDAIDWNGYWKLTIGALNYAIRGTDYEYAYGALMPDMGIWNEGTDRAYPVKSIYSITACLDAIASGASYPVNDCPDPSE